MSVRLLLVRHAQSEWNAEGRWQGWADPPLSPVGEAAALAASRDPILDAIDLAASSDLQRARRTAELLAAPHDWGDVLTYRGVRERGAGAWTGLTRREIEERWPDALRTSVADIPGGEAPDAVTARGVAALHRIAADAEAKAGSSARVLVVTHGALIRLVEAHCGTIPDHVPNLSGRWFDLDGTQLTAGEPAALSTTAAARS